MEIADDGVNYSFGNDVMTHTTMQDVCTVARVFVGRHFRASDGSLCTLQATSDDNSR